MQHSWGWGVGLAWLGAGALLGCGLASDAQPPERSVTPAATGDGAVSSGSEVPGSEAPGSEGTASEVPVGAELPLADGSGAPACVASAEFVPLGAVPDQYYALWNVLDPRAGYAYWVHEYSGGDVRW